MYVAPHTYDTMNKKTDWDFQKTVQGSVEHLEKFGMSLPKGDLCYDPLSCGKMLLAKVIASECQANLVIVQDPELLTMRFEESKAKESVSNSFELMCELESERKDKNLLGMGPASSRRTRYEEFPQNFDPGGSELDEYLLVKRGCREVELVSANNRIRLEKMRIQDLEENETKLKAEILNRELVIQKTNAELEDFSGNFAIEKGQLESSIPGLSEYACFPKVVIVDVGKRQVQEERETGYYQILASCNVIKVPLVARRLHKSKEEMRRELGIQEDAKVEILNGDGQPVGWPFKAEYLADGLIGLVCGVSEIYLPSNFLKLARDTYTPDVIVASNCMLKKSGNGVSEALAYKIPFVFVCRDYFNEDPFLGTMLDVYQISVDMMVIKNRVRQILRGLNYLHTHNPPVIHRDRKCNNIFVNGTHGEVKMGDLGLATIMQQPTSKSVIGRPEFMTPEFCNEEYNELMNIYSFGMCILELVTCEYQYSECINQAQINKKVTSGIKPAALGKVKDLEVRQFIETCWPPASQQLRTSKLSKSPFLLSEYPKDYTCDCDAPQLSKVQKSANSKKSDSHFMDLNASCKMQSCSTYEGSMSGTSMSTLEFQGSNGRNEFSLKREKYDDNSISLTSRIAYYCGQVKNVHFFFYLNADTALSIDVEMIETLDLWNNDDVGLIIHKGYSELSELSESLNSSLVLLDCGVVHANVLTADHLAALEKYPETVVVPCESILQTEVEWLKSSKADLMVSEVVPVAYRTAAEIRPVCVTNFSWDFIYAEYVMAASHHHRSSICQITEAAPRKTKLHNANSAKRLQGEIKRLSMRLGSTFETNEIVASGFLVEANPLRFKKICSEEMITKMYGEQQAIKDHYETRLEQLVSQASLMKNWKKGVHAKIESRELPLEQQKRNGDVTKRLLLSDAMLRLEEPSGLPPVKGVEHSITLVPGALPRKQVPYRSPHFQKDEIKENLKESECSRVKPPKAMMDGEFHIFPENILESKMVPGKADPTEKFLVEWAGSTPSQAEWEDADFIHVNFVVPNPWGQGLFEEGSNVMYPPKRNEGPLKSWEGKRKRSKRRNCKKMDDGSYVEDVAV